MNPIRQALRRNLFQSAVRASGAPAGAKDDPKFYAMVLDFTEDAAAILEEKLLNEIPVPEKGRDQKGRSAQLEAQKRSAEQRRKQIKGLYHGSPDRLAREQIYATLCYMFRYF